MPRSRKVHFSIRQSFGEVAGAIDDISCALTGQNAAATDLAKRTGRLRRCRRTPARRATCWILQLSWKKAALVRGAVSVPRVANACTLPVAGCYKR
jgi:hypothetical protein